MTVAVAAAIAVFGGPALCAAAEAATSTQPALPAFTGMAPARPMISLLLPLNAPAFSAPALAVQKGCEAALAPSAAAIPLDIARTNADPADIAAAWTAAAERGAGVIVGPLTRNAVTALAASLSSSPLGRSAFPASSTGRTIARPPVTLTLNAPEDAASLPPRFYTFGLVIEQEARAVARMAWSDGRRSAYVVQANNPLARRSGQAFAAEWLALGGRIAEADDLDPANLVQLKTRLARAEAEGGDMIFLGADAAEARQARPYLNNQIPVYATSQVNDGRQDAGANVDLAGIRFVDMPWMLQPDHPAVMVYPRPDYPSPELQRFYALGVDACRIAGQMLDPSQPRRIDIDGVTGRLNLLLTPGAAGSAVSREPILAVFSDPSTSAPPPAPDPFQPQ